MSDVAHDIVGVSLHVGNVNFQNLSAAFVGSSF